MNIEMLHENLIQLNSISKMNIEMLCCIVRLPLIYLKDKFGS